MEHIKLLGETLMDALTKLHTTNSELARRRKYEEILGLREELASKDEILGAQQACIAYMSEQLTAEQRENERLSGLIEAMDQEEAVVEEA